MRCTREQVYLHVLGLGGGLVGGWVECEGYCMDFCTSEFVSHVQMSVVWFSVHLCI